jgi:hypothetical protein
VALDDAGRLVRLLLVQPLQHLADVGTHQRRGVEVGPQHHARALLPEAVIGVAAARPVHGAEQRRGAAERYRPSPDLLEERRVGQARPWQSVTSKALSPRRRGGTHLRQLPVLQRGEAESAEAGRLLARLVQGLGGLALLGTVYFSARTGSGMSPWPARTS